MKKIISTSLFILALLATITLNSCKKDDDNGPQGSQKERNLSGTTSKKWKITSVMATAPTAPTPYNLFTLDLYNNKIYAFGSEVSNPGLDIPKSEDCQKDNIWILYQNKTYEVMEGSTKCIGSDPDLITSGTWQLNSNETILSLTDASGTIVEYQIQGLDQKTLKGSTSGSFDYENQTIQYNAVTTFTAQ